jgi:hypothetical protein
VSIGSSDRRLHMNVEFVIWSREGAWFWFLINPRTNGAMISATANEERAIRVRPACRLKPYKQCSRPDFWKKDYPNKSKSIWATHGLHIEVVATHQKVTLLITASAPNHD